MFCTPEWIADVLNFELDGDPVGSPELTTASVSKWISKVNRKLRGIYKIRFGDDNLALLPDEEPDPLTNIWLMLELLCKLEACAGLVLVFTGNVDSKLRSEHKLWKRLSEPLLEAFERGRLDGMVLASPPLSVVPLAHRADCSIATAGFTPSSDPKNGATIEVIDRFILGYTAWVRIRADKHGYNQTVGTLTDDADEGYREQVSLWVRALVFLLHARTGPFTDEIYEVALSLIEAAEKAALRFDRGQEHSTYLED